MPIENPLRVLAAMLGAFVLCQGAFGADPVDEIVTPTGEDVLRESDHVRIRSEFDCGANHAGVDYEAREEEVVSLRAQINGISIGETQLGSIRKDISTYGAFESVAFYCNDTAYNLTFYWSFDRPEPLEISISGFFRDLEK